MSITHAEMQERWLKNVAGVKASGLNKDPPCFIVPKLYLGDLVTARTIPLLGSFEITAVVNCMGPASGTGALYYGDGFCYTQFDFDDEEEFQIAPHFRAASQAISAALQANRSVLVHCSAGVSRSASITIAHLMITNNWSLRKAYEVVAEGRPFILPNKGFVAQLQQLEREILKPPM